jgi:hypothetical protein
MKFEPKLKTYFFLTSIIYIFLDLMKDALIETLKMTLVGDTYKLSDAHNVLSEMAKN